MRNSADQTQYLKTDLAAGLDADLEVDVGAREVVRIISEASEKDNGRFLNIHVPGWENASGPNQYDGKDPPW